MSKGAERNEETGNPSGHTRIVIFGQPPVEQVVEALRELHATFAPLLSQTKGSHDSEKAKEEPPRISQEPE